MIKVEWEGKKERKKDGKKVKVKEKKVMNEYKGKEIIEIRKERMEKEGKGMEINVREVI